MFNKNNKRKNETETFENRKKTTVINNDEVVYYELITNAKKLNEFIFNDNNLFTILNTYYENKLMKIEIVNQILIRNQNTYNLYDKNNKLKDDLKKIHEEVSFEKDEFFKFYNKFKTIYR